MATRQLLLGLPENEQKDFYYSSGQPSEQYINAVSFEKANEIAKYETVIVNIDYPQLTGSEKQIRYAKSLLNKAIFNDIKAISNRLPGLEPLDQRRKSAIDQLVSGINQSGGKASTFSDVVNYIINNKQNSVTQFLKKEKSAGKIIDKYK